jgi:hypothetical protein
MVYPTCWQGSVALLLAIVLPIAALLGALPFILDWPEWALAVLVLAVAGGGTLAGIMFVKWKTDPLNSIEEYRAGKVDAGGDKASGAD